MAPPRRTDAGRLGVRTRLALAAAGLVLLGLAAWAWVAPPAQVERTTTSSNGATSVAVQTTHPRPETLVVTAGGIGILLLLTSAFAGRLAFTIGGSGVGPWVPQAAYDDAVETAAVAVSHAPLAARSSPDLVGAARRLERWEGALRPASIAADAQPAPRPPPSMAPPPPAPRPRTAAATPAIGARPAGAFRDEVAGRLARELGPTVDVTQLVHAAGAGARAGVQIYLLVRRVGAASGGVLVDAGATDVDELPAAQREAGASASLAVVPDGTATRGASAAPIRVVALSEAAGVVRELLGITGQPD